MEKAKNNKNSFFKDMAFLNYNNQSFLVDKFSGFSNVDFSYRFYKGQINIRYFMHIYFSGEKMELCRSVNIPTHYNYRSNFWSVFNDETEEFKFIYRNGENGKNIYTQFKISGFKSEKKSDIISDFVKWFAKNTNTEDTLTELREDIEYCFGYIEEHYKKDNKHKSK